MGKIAKAFDAIAEFGSDYAKYNAKVDDMTHALLRRDHGMDPTQARRAAKVLVTQAEVTWKN